MTDHHRDASDPAAEVTSSPATPATTTTTAAAAAATTAAAAAEGPFDLEPLWQLIEEALPPAAADPFVGTSMGGVRLVRVVGEGGMGRVYEGIQEQPSRTVAVKLQRPGRLEHESTKRFLRELEILGTLSHPALCRVYHAGFLPCGGERLPWFVMEFIADALPINRFAEVHALPLRRRVELFRDVCSGIAVAHAGGVVHRDIKVGNILVGADGLAKVIDFGVATAFRGDLHATRLTHSGHLVGTIESIAPELLAARPPGESPQTDVWSLGVVLHELLTGSSPFRLEEGSIVATMERIRTHRPALAARAASRVGRALGGIVDKALAPAAADRHADAAALTRNLTDLLARFPEGHPDWDAGGHLALAKPRPDRGRWLLPALGVMGISAALAPWAWMQRARGPSLPAAASTSGNESRESLTRGDPPAFSSSPIERADFRHAVRDVDDPEAERYLVESSGIGKWHEDYGQHFRYWGPEAFDVEGRLVYRYDFPRPSRRIYLKANLVCREQSLKEGIIGNGAGALEFSTDGLEWRPLINTLEPRIYGAIVLFDELLPDEACGSRSLWLRVRLLAVGPWKNADYSVAQFLRNRRTDTATCFELAVECAPAAEGADGID
ncbi:MAG: serine/threonine protein kinase [Planctomycetota bacterium]|nr:MAG: serine/threonine protein kinase [Planctomycetota bacterium]